jgi:hypothetical protein
LKKSGKQLLSENELKRGQFARVKLLISNGLYSVFTYWTPYFKLINIFKNSIYIRYKYTLYTHAYIYIATPCLPLLRKYTYSPYKNNNLACKKVPRFSFPHLTGAYRAKMEKNHG